MGMQIPYSLYSEVPEEGSVWKDYGIFEEHISRIGTTEKLYNSGWLSGPRSCAHDLEYTAEIRGL